MSRFIDKMTCKHCGYVWRGLISFGHPDKDFDYRWVCEECGKESTERIEKLPRRRSYYVDRRE